MKTVLVTNIPSPYRITVFDELHKILKDDFFVIYTSRTHQNFNWKQNKLVHNHHFLNESTGNELSTAKGILNTLSLLKPDVIITCGFNPVMLKSMFYAFINKKKLIANTDAWELTEKNYSFLHILIRKVVYKFMNAFIPVSKKGFNNFLRYKLKRESIFISHYAIDNDYSLNYINTPKKYDILFSGQFIDRKMPFFFCEIAEKLAKHKPELRVLLLGDGELKDKVVDRLKLSQINYTYPGFIQKEELPLYYSQSKIFLFPTKVDSWGVVANDACAVGTPVITCENAGSANELIVHDFNGYVLPLNVDIWVEHIQLLLNDQLKYKQFSKNCLSQIQSYNPKEAAVAIANAIKYTNK